VFFRVNEGNVINVIKSIAENWGSIFEIDFAKTISSKADPSRSATVFFLGENIFVNKENNLLGESIFYSNCNAIQTKNLVMEHMKFDISSAFTQLLNEEEKQLVELKAAKADYQNAITILTDKKSMLENSPAEISQHPEVVSLIEAIEEEINFLKEEYSKLATTEFKSTQISEGLGFKPGDEAELSKKKVKIIAVDETGKTITVVDETGATHKVQAIELKSVSKISSPKKGNPLEITTQGDGSSVGIKEAAEEGYVKAKISVPIQTYPKDTVVQVKALDYTSKADGDQIDILLPNNKLVSIKKNDVKLFEAGVYNSETDIKNNPKTKENKPDESTGKMDFVLSGIENQIVELCELKKND